MRLATFLATSLLASCANQPQKPPERTFPTIVGQVVDGESVNLYLYGTPKEHERVSPLSMARWMSPPTYERTQSPDVMREAEKSLSTAGQVTILVNRGDDDMEIERILKVLRKDSKHYIVTFVIPNDDEYERVAKFYDSRVTKMAASLGHKTGKWLRAGYHRDIESTPSILIEATTK